VITNLAVANFIKDYNGSTPAAQWCKDTRPFLNQITGALQKPVLLAKLSGRARTRVEPIALNATVDELFRHLESSFSGKEVKLSDLMKMQQLTGQTAEQFASELQDAVNTANKDSIIVGPALLSAMFIQGLRETVRQPVELHTEGKTFQDLVLFATKVEAMQSRPVMFLKRKFADITAGDTKEEKQEESKTRVARTSCANCGRAGHVTSECRQHIVCFFCKKRGHLSKNCYKRLARTQPNAQPVTMLTTQEDTTRLVNEVVDRVLAARETINLVSSGSQDA